ncbi:MAG: amidohydrolase family protein [Ilumatobacteraceae bacterium]|nr:amidohydrolase family protein [Ilumatobacteraceae bacterium]
MHGRVLGEERAHRGFAWPEYLAHGTTLAFGTDTPTAPYVPPPNMYIAATRKSPSDVSIAPHRPDFALPLADSIGHATRDAAWASHMENERGRLRAGRANHHRRRDWLRRRTEQCGYCSVANENKPRARKCGMNSES